MGPIRRSRKRKPEPEPPAHPAAPEAEARGGKPVRFLLRSSERLRTPPQPRPEPAPSSQVRGRRRQRVPRRVYRFLADLSSSDAMVCYKRGKKVVEKSVREASKSVATSEELTNTENDIGKEAPNDATDSGILPEINTTICIDSAPVKNNKGSQESDIHEIIPNQMPVGMHGIYQEHYIGALHRAAEYGSTSHNFGAADVFLSNSSTQYGNNATKADKCATSMEQDIGEESFEQYLVMDDGSNDNLMPSIKSSQAISHEHHSCKDNVATIMECETSCAVATKNMSIMPLALINDVVPNLLPSNVISDVGKTGHRGDTELPGNTAIQHATSDSPFSDIFVPAFRGITTNTQSSTKKFAAEEQEEMSPEHHTSPMKEYACLSSHSIGKSAMDQFFSTDIRNTTEAEHGIGLTMPQYAEGTMSECVAIGTDFSYCPLLHKSLVVPESTVADRPSEPLATENPPFLRTSHMWAHIEGMEIFKKVPQRPHFHPFKELGPELSEAMALGLMVFFANTAESIKNLNIQDEIELFKEKLKGLCLLEEHGFDVRHLRSRLETLLHMKNSNSELQNAIKKLEEKITLKEIDGQQRGTQISRLYTATRQLERQAKLFRCILKSSVSQQKTNALEISRLKTEACDIEKSCLSVEQQFSSVVAAPW